MAFLSPILVLSSSSSSSSSVSSFASHRKCSTLGSRPSIVPSPLLRSRRVRRRRVLTTGGPSMDLDGGYDDATASAGGKSVSSSGGGDEVTVRRVSGDKDLDVVYGIWNAVAEAEGLPCGLKPDDDDAASSTVHFIAEMDNGTAVAAGRVLFVGANNALLDRCCVLPPYRLKGIGRSLVGEMMRAINDNNNNGGVVYVDASRGSEMGFFSILGFEPVANDRFCESRNTVVRTMVLPVPECAPPSPGGCVGLHHASLRVSDIERSLAFYGCVGFIVHEKFVTANGNRACFVQGLGTRLELVECPIAQSQSQSQSHPHASSAMIAGVNMDQMQTGNGSAGGASGNGGHGQIGFDRLVFDVTKACTDLDTYLQHLARRNGGHLQVAGPPAKQVVGNSVMAVASILDPDGMPIEFIRREAQVPGELQTRVKW